MEKSKKVNPSTDFRDVNGLCSGSHSKIKLNVCKEVKDALKSNRIVEIVGSMKTGKTTTALNIAELKKRDVILISPEHSKHDEELVKKYQVEMLPKGAKFRKRIDSLGKGYTVIFDDAQALTRSQKEYLDGILISLREEKRDLHLIIVHHIGRKISMDILENNDCFLVVKRGANFKPKKINQYFDIDRRAIPSIELCDSLKDYQSIYLFKDGKFGINSNDVSLILPKKIGGKLKYDYDGIVKSMRNGMSVEKIADGFKCSISTIYDYWKIAKTRNPELCTYRQEGKKSQVRKFPQEKGYRKRGTLNLIWHIDILRAGKTTGEKQNKITRYKVNEDIGNKATRIIGEILEDMSKEKLRSNPKSSFYLEIDETPQGGDDITLTTPKKRIEIEVKNWKKTPKRRHICPSDVEGTKYKTGIKDKFTEEATDKWLFSCGVKPSKEAMKLLDKYDIKHLSLTTKQISNPVNPSQKHRCKRKLKSWVFGNL